MSYVALVSPMPAMWAPAHYHPEHGVRTRVLVLAINPPLTALVVFLGSTTLPFDGRQIIADTFDEVRLADLRYDDHR